MSTKFQPINAIELLSTVTTSEFLSCAQLCNENILCRTFDYDSTTFICRLFEGAVQTGSIISSGSLTSRVGAVRLYSNLFAAFGEPCEQCSNSRYLVCSPNSSNTCQCPKNTIWDGIQCVNQRYEDGMCSTNQGCREDVGLYCSNLRFCTKYRCGNMTINKRDMPGYDLAQQTTANFSLCCSWCQSYSGCKAFTWVSAPGIFFGKCYLKWWNNTSPTPSNDHVSAYY